jgi:hypothetical protein
MSQVTEKKPVASRPVVLTPEEVFWQRYSPHHECLLSWVSSVTLHGLVVGALLLIALTAWWAKNSEANPLRPPNMDVVQLEGGGDGGLEGGGAEPGPLQASSGKTEAVTDNNPKKTEATLPQQKFLMPKTQELELPALVDIGEPARDIEMLDSLKKITQEVEQAMQIAPPVEKAEPKDKGTTTGKTGKGGQGGGGVGTGKGSKTGPGTGGGGPGGRKATRAEILAHRWRFDMSGDGKEHADKLDAVGVTLAIPDGAGFRLITDLKRRPVDAQRDSLVRFKDAIKWYNLRPESVASLTRELQIQMPRDLAGRSYVILLLPKDREQKMADVERRYAESQGRPVRNIRATWFDFRLRNGVYEPVVIRQE